MIKWWQGLVLGMLQGLTEFLPVSSSGHLALAQNLFQGFAQPGVLFDVALHLATSVAVVVYFYQDLVSLLKREAGKEAVAMSGSGEMEKLGWSLGWPLIAAMVPTGVIGFLLKDRVVASFQKPLFVGIFLLITALVLFAADLVFRLRKDALLAKDPGLWQSLIIGIAQGLAVFPGISRSGATIATGIFTGSRGDYAARFSFLLSVPAVLGASALSLFKERDALLGFPAQELWSYLLGMLAAFIVGYFSIKLMFLVVKRVRLSWFGIYCAGVGLATVIIMSWR